MDGDGLRMLVLESVAAGLVQNEDEAQLLLRSTLCWHDKLRGQAGQDIRGLAGQLSKAVQSQKDPCQLTRVRTLLANG